MKLLQVCITDATMTRIHTQLLLLNFMLIMGLKFFIEYGQR